ncbi:MAG: hypothetical protein LBT97_05970 [Planctomycetota bacterium]|jgi:hypothetical protein|nr:hypothetical protein [Planctomycetota bacterium]
MRKHAFALLFALAVIPAGARAVDKPTRPTDIEFNEMAKRQFTDLKLTFAAEHVFYDTNNNLVVDGTIVNHSTFTVDNIAIDCRAANADGTVVASTRTLSFPRRLRPAQQGNVKIVFSRRGINIDKITYALVGRKPFHARDADQIGDSLRYLPDMELSPFYAPMLR